MQSANPASSVIVRNPRTRAWRVLALLLAGGAALFAAAAALIGHFYLTDAPPPADADLRVAAAAAPPTENGLRELRAMSEFELDFLAFCDRRGVPEEDAWEIAQGRRRDNATLDAYLLEMQPARARLQAALAMPAFRFEGGYAPQTILVELGVARKLAAMLRHSIRRQLEQGNRDGAIADIAVLHRLAAAVAGCGGPVIHWLSAQNLTRINAQPIRDLLNDPALTPGQLTALAAATSPPIEWAPAFRHSLPVDYEFMISLLQSIQDDTLRGEHTSDAHVELWDRFIRLTLLPNATLLQLAERYRALLAASDLDYAASRSIVQNAFPPFEHPGIAFMKPNYAGRTLVEGWTSGMSGVVTSLYVIVAEIRLLQTGLALRAYHQEHGALPADLHALVPKYLPAVPTDPFDSQPLRYDPAKGLVYSVGIALADKGGSVQADLADESAEFGNPLTDWVQPTLVLTFQKSAVASPP